MSDTHAMQRRNLPFKLSAPENDKLAVHVIYALYAANLIFQIPIILAVIIAYLKRGDVQGTYLETHVRWQVRTFWLWLLMTVVGGLTWWVLGLGFLLVGFAYLWLIYRVVKGWLKLSNEEPIAGAGDFF